MKRFRCACCNGVFYRRPGLTDDEIRAEHDERFPEAAAATPEQLRKVCDRCYAGYNAWFDTLPAAERERMKEHARAHAGAGHT